MGERIFITGAKGFIGRKLTDILAKQNISCTNLDREQTAFNNTRELVKLLDGSDSVIHLAGKTHGDKADLVEANIDSTRFLLQAISRLDKKPILIFASTFAVYGVQNNLLSEESDNNPRNMYGETKLVAEKLIGEYSNKFNINSLILRFSNVYGPDMPPYTHSVVATFIDQAINDVPITINSTGEQKRDFIYIDDVVNALLKVIGSVSKSDVCGIINICSNIPTSMNELAEKIGEVIGKKINIHYPTPDQIDEGNWIGDNSRARNILGWQPEVNLQLGIEKCYENKK